MGTAHRRNPKLNEPHGAGQETRAGQLRRRLANESHRERVQAENGGAAAAAERPGAAEEKEGGHDLKNHDAAGVSPQSHGVAACADEARKGRGGAGQKVRGGTFLEVQVECQQGPADFQEDGQGQGLSHVQAEERPQEDRSVGLAEDSRTENSPERLFVFTVSCVATDKEKPPKLLQFQ